MAYAQITPKLRSVGKFTVRKPFTVVDGTIYTCVAIRTFKDMRNDGIDVASTVYNPVNLTDGSPTDYGNFSLAQEEISGVNIISLANKAGEIIHVPDNYITSFPSSSGVELEHIVLGVSVGLLPVGEDSSYIESAVKEAVIKVTGIAADGVTVNVGRVDSINTLTQEQYDSLMINRNNTKRQLNTPATEVAQLQQQLEQSRQTCKTYETILKDKNIIPR